MGIVDFIENTGMPAILAGVFMVMCATTLLGVGEAVEHIETKKANQSAVVECIKNHGSGCMALAAAK